VFDQIRVAVEDPDVGSLTFDAWASGPDGGDLVLLLHGFPQTKRSYRAQLPALGAAGYRAVAVDQRGYSPMPARSASSTTTRATSRAT
jgi:pimeloyl-ACP methyl ester carboxylesterase